VDKNIPKTLARCASGVLYKRTTVFKIGNLAGGRLAVARSLINFCSKVRFLGPQFYPTKKGYGSNIEGDPGERGLSRYLRRRHERLPVRVYDRTPRLKLDMPGPKTLMPSAVTQHFL